METLVRPTYIGLPFKEHGRDRAGVDCWGYLRLRYQEQFGIALPDYTESYRTTQDEQEIAAIGRAERLAWTEIPLAAAREGDVLVLRLRGQPMHCGIIETPPAFTHAIEGVGVVRERWDSMKWRDRIIGVYRHQAMPVVKEPQKC